MKLYLHISPDKRQYVWYYPNPYQEDDPILHNTETFSWTIYYENGPIQSLDWRINNKRHRIEGPSFIEFYATGELKKSCWYQDGMLHREIFPARLEWHPNGDLITQQWYHRDVDITDKVAKLCHKRPDCFQFTPFKIKVIGGEILFKMSLGL